MSYFFSPVLNYKLDALFCLQAEFLLSSCLFCRAPYLPSNVLQVPSELDILRMLSQKLIEEVPLEVIAQGNHFLNLCLLMKAEVSEKRPKTHILWIIMRNVELNLPDGNGVPSV